MYRAKNVDATAIMLLEYMQFGSMVYENKMPRNGQTIR